MTVSAEPMANPAAADSRWLKFAIALGLVGLADSLFYDRSLLGLAQPLFIAVLAATSIVVNAAMTTRTRLMGAAVLFVAGAVPAVEELGLLSLPIMFVMMLSAVAFATHSTARGFSLPLRAIRDLLLIGPLRLVPDLIMMLREHSLTRALLIWSIPLTLGAVFALLFSVANPVIAHWLDVLGSNSSSSELSVARLVFWLLALAMIWPFVHLHWRQRIKPPQPAVAPEPDQQGRMADWRAWSFRGWRLQRYLDTHPSLPNLN